MKNFRVALALLASLFVSSAASGQNVFNTAQSGKTVVGVVSMCLNVSGVAVPTNQSGNCPGGGGSSGSVFGPDAIGVAPTHPPIMIGGTSDGTGTGLASIWKVASGIGFINCANCSGSGISVAFAGAIGAVGTPGGFKDGSGNFQSFLGDTTNGQWVNVKASVAVPVTGTFFQATQPISGTVTANAGTNLNTSALAIETGGNLAALVTNIGAPGSAVCANDTASCSTNQQMQRLAARLTTINSTLNTPFQVGGSIGNTSFGISGTLPAYAAIPTFKIDQTTPGTTNLVSIGTNGTINPTTASSWGINTLGSTTSGQSGELALGAVTIAAPTYVTGQSNALSLTTGGLLRVDGSGVTQPVSLTSTTITGTVAATQSGTWNVTNISGTVSLPTGAATSANQTSVIGPVTPGTAATNSLLVAGTFNSTPITVTNTQQAPLQVDANGYLKINVAVGGGTGGTSSTIGAAYPSIATAVGMSQGGNMVAMTGTSGNLNVQCANCSGSGASAVDQATMTFGTSVFAPMGGVYQTTATSNPLTSGQQGMAQLTINRAVHMNLRNAVGVQVGDATTPLQVSLANTGANGTALAVSMTSTTITGTVAVTQSGAWSLSANQSVNVAQINGVTPLMGNGVSGTGSQRVNIASDNTAFTVNPASAIAPVSTMNSASAAAGVTAANAFVFDDVSPTAITENNFGYARMSANRNIYQTIRDAAGNERGANVSAGNALLVDASATTQPVSNAGTFAVQASIATASAWGINTLGSTTSGQSGQLALGAVTTAAPTYTTAQSNAFSLDTSGNLRVLCSNCSGSGVSQTDSGTFTATSSLFASGGGFFQTTATNNPLTTGQFGTFQVTANRALFTNLRNASGTEIGTSGAPLRVDPTGTTTQPVSLTSTTITGTVAATQSGNWTSRVVGNGGATMDVAVGGAAAPTNALVLGGIYNSSPITITNTQAAAAQLDVNGYLKVNVQTALGLAQGSTTSGQTGSMVMGAVTTSAPTYTTAQTAYLSLDTAGGLRVNCTTGCSTSTAQQAPLNAGTATATNAGVIGGQFLTTQPTMTNTQQAAILLSSRGELLVAPGVSGFAVTLASTTVTGTVAVTQSGSWSLAANQSVNVAQINGVTPLMGNGVTGTGSPRVTLVSDGTAISTAGYMSIKIDQTTPGTTNNVTIQSNTSPVSTMNSASAASGVTAANAFVFDDVSPTAITENSFGYGRMSANRNQYHTIRDAAGNERGANVSAGNALLVDGSATTQPVNVSQFGGVSTATGQVAVSVAPVTATNTALVTALRPDSPGIISLGQTTKSASVPVTVASDQLGTATPAASLPTVLSAGTGNTVTGSYCMAVKSGTMAAGLAANAPIASFRFGAAAIALIRKVTFTAENAGTGFAAGVATFDLFAARSFSASDTTGNAATITGNNGKLRTSYATTGISDFRAAATATLTAGTRTLDATPLNSLTVPASTAASIALVNPNTTLFDGRVSEVPVILAQNEGVVLQATVPATGTWSFTAQVCWDEMASF